MQELRAPVNEKLEIPQLDSPRGRKIALVAGVIVLGAAVAAPIERQLIEVAVQPGDEVEKGQLLARLDEVSAETDAVLRLGIEL